MIEQERNGRHQMIEDISLNICTTEAQTLQLFHTLDALFQLYGSGKLPLSLKLMSITPTAHGGKESPRIKTKQYASLMN